MSNIVNTNMNPLWNRGLGCDSGWDQFVDLEIGNKGIMCINKRSLNFWGDDKDIEHGVERGSIPDIDERWLDEGWMSEGIFGNKITSWDSVVNNNDKKDNHKKDSGVVYGMKMLSMAFYYGYNIMDWIISG